MISLLIGGVSSLMTIVKYNSKGDTIRDCKSILLRLDILLTRLRLMLLLNQFIILLYNHNLWVCILHGGSRNTT